VGGCWSATATWFKAPWTSPPMDMFSLVHFLALMRYKFILYNIRTCNDLLAVPWARYIMMEDLLFSYHFYNPTCIFKCNIIVMFDDIRYLHFMTCSLLNDISRKYVSIVWLLYNMYLSDVIRHYYYSWHI